MNHGKLVVGVHVAVEIVAIVGTLTVVVVDVAENSIAGDTDIGCLITLICCIDRGHSIRID